MKGKKSNPAKAQKLQSLFGEALRLQRSGRLMEADSLYRQVLMIDQRHADSLFLRGTIAVQAGRRDIATDLFSLAVEANPANASFHFSLGDSLGALDRAEEAIAAFRQGLKLKPDDAEAQHALGVLLRGKKDNRGAECCFRNALALDPQHPGAHNNLGVCRKAGGMVTEATESFRRSVLLRQGDAYAWFNLGNALHDRMDFDTALAAFRNAVALSPGHAGLYNNMAITLEDAWRLDDAEHAHRRSLALAPDRMEAHSAYLAFQYYRPEADENRLLALARQFGDRFKAQAIAPVFAAPRTSERLRIGYVSGDFRDHPVGYFLTPVLRHHNHSAFEIFCYDNASKADATTERLKTLSGHWRDIGALSDDRVARTVAEDEIDILIDLAGHTARNRLAVFARKPAPIQASWLGYWGTTGLAAMNYLISDETTIPPGAEATYSERIVRLPGNRFCYEPPNYAPRPPVESPLFRHGFPTFGSFTNPNKISRDTISLWADTLRAVPASRLLLKWRTLANATVQYRLRDAFGSAGVSNDRLIFRGESPHAQMLAEYADIDIALDPVPFSGGLTSCEALWMGVPVVTLRGVGGHSRQTLGFLGPLGLEDLVAATKTEFVSIAKGLANDDKRLEALRLGLRATMAASPLCDGAAFTRGLEDAFREMRRGALAEHRPS